MSATFTSPPALSTPSAPLLLNTADFFQNIRYVTLKVTNGCNLKCRYCNVEADLPSTPRMAIDTYKRVAELLISNSRSPFVGLEFHGGEPMLLSDEWYEEAVTFARNLGRKHKKHVSHPMQTNGTMLTDARLDTMVNLGIHVGFSYDGPPQINDVLRGSSKAVEAAMRRVMNRGLGFGMILVLSPANCDHMYEVMDYFRDFGITDFRINFMQPQGRGLGYPILTSDQMFEGIKQVFEHMADTKCSVIEADVQLLVNRYIHGRQANPGLSCWELECQAGRNYVAIDHLGNIFACGTDMSQHGLGNINSDTMDAEQVQSTLKRLHKKDAWYVRCFDCSARRVCNQSCPTSDYNDPMYRESECGYTKQIYRYFHENQSRVEAVHAALQSRRPEPPQL